MPKSSKVYGTPLVCGVPASIPEITGDIPVGKRRFRFRNTGFALLFVRPKHGGISEFYLEDHGTFWRARTSAANVVQFPAQP